MASFYPLVLNSVHALADREAREAAYERSRSALRAMQTSGDPFSAEQVTAQTRDLEDAIERVEREKTAASAIPQASPPVSASARLRAPLPRILPPPTLPSMRSNAEAKTAAVAVPPQIIDSTDATRGKPRHPVIALAALAAVLLSLAAWIYLRTPPSPQTATARVDPIAQGSPATEIAVLHRRQVDNSGSASWRAEPPTSADAASSGFRAVATFPSGEGYASGLRVAFAMNGNSTAANPAAQIAEIRFTTPDDRPLDVSSVGGVLIRRTDTESGQPLLGLTATTTVPGLFIVGTSPLAKDIDANGASLRDAAWIDIAFVQPDGVAAVVSIAVGKGQTVIRSAQNAWSRSGR